MILNEEIYNEKDDHLFVLIIQKRLIADFNVQREELGSNILLDVQIWGSGRLEESQKLQVVKSAWWSLESLGRLLVGMC